MARSEKVFLGRENRLVRELTRAGQPLGPDDKSAITRVQAHIGTTCLDTDDPADPITYADGKITMQLGLVTTLEPGTPDCHLTIHDPVHPLGLAWGSFPLEIILWPNCEAT